MKTPSCSRSFQKSHLEKMFKTLDGVAGGRTLYLYTANSEHAELWRETYLGVIVKVISDEQLPTDALSVLSTRGSV